MNNTMDSNSTQNNSQPVYCANNCGFFGNPMFQNMCSKCFRDQQKSSNTSASTSNTSNSGKEAVAANSLQQHESFISHGSEVKVEIDPSSRPDTADSSCTSETTSAAAGLNNDSKEQEQQQQQQANPSRCFICKSKITLAKQISNKCRCNLVFCDGHRVPDRHDCKFDHTELQKNILAKKNPGLEESKGGRSFTRLD